MSINDKRHRNITSMYKKSVNRERRRVVRKAAEVCDIATAAINTTDDDDDAESIATLLLLLLLLKTNSAGADEDDSPA